MNASLPGAKRRSNLAILALSLLISACSYTVPLQSPLGQVPLVEKAPISVAIHYAEELRNHKCTVSKGYIAESWPLELGPPSIEMFGRIFSALFDKVIPPDSGFKIQAAAGQHPLIELRLLEFDGCEASWPIFGTSIEVAYEATLRSTEGVLIALWQGRGRAGPGDDLSGYKEVVLMDIFGLEARYLGAVTSLAMRKAAADFIINYDKNLGIRAWLGR